MKICIIDDEPVLLELMEETVREITPDAEVRGFTEPRELLGYAGINPFDVAFLDIDMSPVNGIEVAKQLKRKQPKINLIFVTGYSEYMSNAFQMHASGYVMKPPTKEKIEQELQNLRNPVKSSPVPSESLKVQCFGNFEAFVDNKPVKFGRMKTKELLALLIDRRGTSVTAGEICSYLWEEEINEFRQKNYLRILILDLSKSLKEIGMEDILIRSRNSCSINTSKIRCDYYDYLNNLPEGIRAYNGEYMTQYSWAETTLGQLSM